MRQFCQVTTCRREFICSHFGVELGDRTQRIHDCCDICETICDCTECTLFKGSHVNHPNSLSNSEPSEAITDYLEMHLRAYFAEVKMIDSTLHLSRDTAHKIASCYQVYCDIKFLRQDFNHLSEDVLTTIVFLINENMILEETVTTNF